MSSPECTSLNATFVDELRQLIRDEQFATWFRGLRIVDFNDTEVELAVLTGFQRDWITRNFHRQVAAAVTATFNGPRELRIRLSPLPAKAEPAGNSTNGVAAAESPAARAVRNEVERAIESVETLSDDASAQDTGTGPALDGHSGIRGPAIGWQRQDSGGRRDPAAQGAGSRDPRRDAPRQWDSSLNKNYNFREFVVGPCNRLAHAAALAIGSAPGQSYNPFFVHGSVGLGKTHLLQAICHVIKRTWPDARVVYLSCEDFTNRYIQSLQNRTLDAFRDYHRSADVLVIDDVEFLANKTQTQVEFFHTFNALYNAQKQIVLSSDRQAPDIPTLEERLISRFKWGLETAMELPCFETRVAIVKRKGELRSQEIPDAVAHHIADQIATNVRELEGAVTRVLSLATLTGKSIDLDLAQEALRGESAPPSHKTRLVDVLSLITNEFSITAKDLKGKSRAQAISLPRQVGMFLARKFTDHSLQDIGRFFGNRDHTTVIYAVSKIENRSNNDRMFANLLEELGRRLRSGRPSAC